MPNQLSPDIVAQGFNLLIFGMGIVVLFLTLLVFATTIMSKVVQKFFPEAPVPESSLVTSVDVATASTMPEARILTAIEVAIRQHREKTQQ